MDAVRFILYLFLGAGVIASFMSVYIYESSHRIQQANKRVQKLRKK